MGHTVGAHNGGLRGLAVRRCRGAADLGAASIPGDRDVVVPTTPYDAKSWRRSFAVTLDARLLTAMFMRMPSGEIALRRARGPPPQDAGARDGGAKPYTMRVRPEACGSSALLCPTRIPAFTT